MKAAKLKAASILRKKAEELIDKRTYDTNAQLSESETLKLIHELEVHRIELELQNEELMQANSGAKDAIELYDFAPSGYFTLSKSGEIIRLNLNGAKMLGKERLLLRNNLFSFFVSDDTRPVFNNFLEKVMEGKAAETCELALSVNGNSKLSVHLSGIIANNGSHCLVTVVDISEIRKLTELNEILLDSLPYPAMYIRRKDRVVVACNKIALDFGVKPGGHCWRDFMKTGFITDHEHVILAENEDVVLSDLGIKCSFCVGDQCYSGYPQQNNPEVHAFGLIWNTYWIKVSDEVFLHYAIDITERKKAEEEIRESESRLRHFIDSNVIGVVIATVDGKLIEANDYYLNLIGYGREEFNAGLVDWRAITPPEWLHADDKSIHELREKGVTVNYEKEYIRRDGTRVAVMVADTLFPGSDELLAGFILDITSRKEAEKVIQLQNEELLFSNAEKDKFFSIIAHDLRSPFNGFLGLTEIMAEKLPTMSLAEIQKIAVVLRNSATNLFRLLGNLLEWSRMQRGLTEFAPTTFLLMPKITESLASVLCAANEKGVAISYDITEEIEVFADVNMFECIIRNLVSNAVKFSSKGGEIVVSAKNCNDSSVEISVKDQGIGMNQEMMNNLFRLDVNTCRRGTENEYSTGLGLIICKDFIEKHGGELRVESDPEGISGEKGSTFRFMLPGKA